jgi:hypothetical protein
VKSYNTEDMDLGPLDLLGNKHMPECSSQRLASVLLQPAQQFTSLLGTGGCGSHVIQRA